MKNCSKEPNLKKNQHPDRMAQVGLDRATPQKTDHQACGEPRPSQQLKENRERRGSFFRIHLEADREVSSKQVGIAGSFHELHWDWKAVSRVIKSMYTAQLIANVTCSILICGWWSYSFWERLWSSITSFSPIAIVNSVYASCITNTSRSARNLTFRENLKGDIGVSTA